jgi:hypothetical protein
MSESNMQKFIGKMILDAPSYVWFVFVYLIFVGVKATKDRKIYLPKLFITPIILTAIKYKIFLNSDLKILFSYLACLLVGMLFGFKIATCEKFEIISGKLQIKVPGNYSTLILLILFFVIKYIFGYLEATNQELYSEIMILEIAVSGLFSGYFLGRALKYFSCYLTSDSK